MHGDVRVTTCETAWTRRKHTVNAWSEIHATVTVTVDGVDVDVVLGHALHFTLLGSFCTTNIPRSTCTGFRSDPHEPSNEHTSAAFLLSPSLCFSWLGSRHCSSRALYSSSHTRTYLVVYLARTFLFFAPLHVSRRPRNRLTVHEVRTREP